MKNLKFFRAALFFLLLFFTGSIVAQTQLKGKVTDFMTFRPIENASVYLKNTTIGSVTNSDGNFSLRIPSANENDTLVISSIGYKTFLTAVGDFENGTDIFLEEEIASLDEVVLQADTRPKTGNDIMLRAIERLPENLPDASFIQRGFLRHKERNKNEYRWLVEAAISMYDEHGGRNKTKLNVDEIRKSLDSRDIDSLFTFSAHQKFLGVNVDPKTLDRRRLKTSQIVEAIRWNDRRVNGLENLFEGKLNLLKNIDGVGALFGKNMLTNHQFDLDTILVDSGRKIYKIKISPGKEYVNLNTPHIFNDGLAPHGWVYVYYDNYAIKKIDYDLVAASDVQKRRSRSLFDTQTLHKLKLNYLEYDGKMYLNYVSYETPKLVNTGDRSSEREKTESQPGFDKGSQYYYTVQEILFTDILEDENQVRAELNEKKWVADLFSPGTYNAAFWEDYNVLLESEEEEKLIRDLSRRAALFE